MKRALLVLMVLIGCGKDDAKPEPKPGPGPGAKIDPITAEEKRALAEAEEQTVKVGELQAQLDTLDRELDAAIGALDAATDEDQRRLATDKIAQIKRRKQALKVCVANPTACEAQHEMWQAKVSMYTDAIAEAQAELDAATDGNARNLAERKLADAKAQLDYASKCLAGDAGCTPENRPVTPQ